MKTPTEADFLTQVLTLARLHGWRTMHVRPAWTKKGWRTPLQGDGKGFPDLLMLKAGRIIIAELKGPRGALQSEQKAWLEDFRKTGVDVFVWKPANWPQIEEELSK